MTFHCSKVEVYGPSWVAGSGSTGLPSFPPGSGGGEFGGGLLAGSYWSDKLAALLGRTGPYPSVQPADVTPNAIPNYPPLVRPTNVSIGGSQVCQQTKSGLDANGNPKYDVSGDGGAARVLQLIREPYTHQPNQPHLSPVSLLVIYASGYNDLANGAHGSGAQIPADDTRIDYHTSVEPVKASLRAVISRFKAARIIEDEDSFFTYSGTAWNAFGRYVSKLYGSGSGFSYTSHDGDSLSFTVPSDVHANAILGFVHHVGLINGSYFSGTVNYSVSRGGTVVITDSVHVDDAVIPAATSGGFSVSGTVVGKRIKGVNPGDVVTVTFHPTTGSYLSFDCMHIEGVGGAVVLPKMPEFTATTPRPTGYGDGIATALNGAYDTLATEFTDANTVAAAMTVATTIANDDITKLTIAAGAKNYHPNDWGQSTIAKAIHDALGSASTAFADAAAIAA